MKRMKRLLSMVLAAVMLVTCVPLNAFAEEETGNGQDNVEENIQEDVQMLSEIEESAENDIVLMADVGTDDGGSSVSIQVEKPAADLKSIFSQAGGIAHKIMSVAGKWMYKHAYENDDFFMKFLSKLMIGGQAAALIDIQFKLEEIVQQLHVIEAELGQLSLEMTEGFNELTGQILKAEYDSIVDTYLMPVVSETRESMGRYVHLYYHLYCYSAERTDGGTTAEERQQMEEMLTKIKALNIQGWATYEAQWNIWEETSVEYAFEQALAKWGAATEKIDFEECSQMLESAMSTYGGKRSLTQIQEERLRLEYAFEHQIIPEMEQAVYYVTDLQARLMLLSSEYTDYLNTLDSEKTYETQELADDAVRIMNIRVKKLENLATEMVEIVNKEAEDAGIHKLMALGENDKLTLSDGSEMDVYRVKCNADRQIYYISKGKHYVTEQINYQVDEKHGWTYGAEGTPFLSKRFSQDGRYQLVNYDVAGGDLNSFFEHRGTTGNIVTWLRDECGLTEVYGGSHLLLTGKYEEHTPGGAYCPWFWYFYYLNLRDFNHKLPLEDQYYVLQTPHFLREDSRGKEKVTLYPGMEPVFPADLTMIYIYKDTHILPGDESGKIGVGQLSSLGDITTLLDGDVVDFTKAYNDVGVKTFYVNGNVKITGNGENAPLDNVTFILNPGANLTMENICLSGATDEAAPILICDGENTKITLVGTNKIQQGKSQEACITSYEDAEGANVTITGENLTLEAGKGLCISDVTVNAENVNLATSGGSAEVEVNNGSAFKNCTINSASGKYDVDDAIYTECTWTNYAPYKVILQTGDMNDSQSNDTLKLDIDGTVVDVKAKTQKDQTQTFMAYGKALTDAQQKLKLKMGGSNDWYGVRVQIYSNASDYSAPDGNYMVAQWVDKNSWTDAISNGNYGFKLKITTGNITNAGTDANITAAFAYTNPGDGKTKISEYVNLSTRVAGNAFEKGKTDTVYIRQDQIPTNVSMDRIKWVYVKTDMKNASAGWYLEKAEIEIYKGAESQTMDLVSPQQWLVDAGREYVFNLPGGQTRQYRFTVNTGTIKNAGTDAGISFKLIGGKGETEWIRANNYITNNAFEKGDKDVFTLVFDKNIGNIAQICVKSDLKNSAAGWYCDSITVQEYNAVSGVVREAQVDVHRWFDKKNGAEESFIVPSANSVMLGSARQATYSLRSLIVAPEDTGASDETTVKFTLNPEEHWGIIKQLRIYRSETIDGTYTRYKVLENGNTQVTDDTADEDQHYYYKIFIERENGELLQLGRIVGIHSGAFSDMLTKIEADIFTDEHISQELKDVGYMSAEQIYTAMQNEMLNLDERISADTMELYNLDLYYFNGEEWVVADGTHFDKVDKLRIFIPVPEESDPLEDEYFLLHMFGGNKIGKAGDIHQLNVEVYTNEAGETYLVSNVKGFSPFMVGWVDADAANELDNVSDVPETGDSSIAMMYLGLMMAASVLLCTGIRRRKTFK